MDSNFYGLKRPATVPDVVLRAATGEGKHLKQGGSFEVFFPKVSSKGNIILVDGKPVKLETIPAALLGQTSQVKVVKKGLQLTLEVVSKQAQAVLTKESNQNQTATKSKTTLGQQLGVKGIREHQHGAQQAAVKGAGKNSQAAHVESKLLKANLTHQTKNKMSAQLLTGTSHRQGVIENQKQVAGNELLGVQANKTKQSIPQVMGQLIGSANSGRKMTAEVAKRVSDMLPKAQLLTTPVNQRLANGNIVFQWQGQSFESKAPAQIQVGDTLVLQNSSTDKKSSVEVIDVVTKVPHKANQLLRRSLAKSDPVGQVMQVLSQAKSSVNLSPNLVSGLNSLTAVLQNFVVSPEQPLDGPRLAGMIKSSGILHESQLGQLLKDVAKPDPQFHQANLKGSLMQLAARGKEEGSATQAKHVQQTAELGVNRIESQQALNLLAQQQAEPIRLELPIQVHGQFTTVQIAVFAQHAQVNIEDEGSNTEDNDRSFKILFSLELSGLGALSIDVKISETSVYAMIYSGLETSRDFIQNRFSVLSDTLQSLGFHDVQLSVGSLEQVQQETKETFYRLSSGLPITQGLLDVRG
ncbi:MAG: hypothetical protein R8M46_00665 [Ghiorsea sp.]